LINGSKSTIGVTTNSNRKRQLLETAFGRGRGDESEGDNGSRELLGEVTRYLDAHHPELTFEVRREDHSHRRGRSPGARGPLRTRALRRVAPSGGLCLFPFPLESRVQAGHDARRTSIDRADLRRQLSRPTNAFFERLKPDRSFWPSTDPHRFTRAATSRRAPDEVPTANWPTGSSGGASDAASSLGRAAPSSSPFHNYVASAKEFLRERTRSLAATLLVESRHRASGHAGVQGLGRRR